jgi:uncharacterized protein YkwD
MTMSDFTNRRPSCAWALPHIAALLLLACAPAAAADDDWPLRVLGAINQARLLQGQRELRWSSELQAIAQTHSDAMAARARLSHEGFQARLESTTSLLCVENVAAGSTSPATLVAAWNKAPQHRRNLYEPRVSHAGIAQAGGYVTLFACE